MACFRTNAYKTNQYLEKKNLHFSASTNKRTMSTESCLIHNSVHMSNTWGSVNQWNDLLSKYNIATHCSSNSMVDEMLQKDLHFSINLYSYPKLLSHLKEIHDQKGKKKAATFTQKASLVNFYKKNAKQIDFYIKS